MLELRTLVDVLPDDDALGLVAVFIRDARFGVQLRELRLGRFLRLADEIGQDARIAFMKIEHAGQRADHDRDQREHCRDRRDRQPFALAHAPDAMTAACGCLSAHIFSSGIDRMDRNFKETSI